MGLKREVASAVLLDGCDVCLSSFLPTFVFTPEFTTVNLRSQPLVMVLKISDCHCDTLA